MRRLCVLTMALFPMLAPAHPLAPALLELRETGPGDFAVTWRTSVSRVRHVDVTPELPCTTVGSVTSGIEAGEAYVARWSARCPELTGARIAVAGIEQSGINVIVRIERREGAVINGILDATHPALTVPASGAVPSTLARYFQLGVAHLLTGLDHVSFVLGLVVLVGTLRRLVLTITAFTAGHSLTLGLATLGLVHVNQAVAELGIALSILVLACELVREREKGDRHLFPAGSLPLVVAWWEKVSVPFFSQPWLMAGAFGLLHGLGFAGALAEAGLPAGEIPLSLFAFNAGIEAGQLALVAVALAGAFVVRAIRKAPPGPVLARATPAYIIGALAACWCFERCVTLAAQLGVL